MAHISHQISGTAGLKYLTEDETLFRDSVRQFARETISPAGARNG